MRLKRKVDSNSNLQWGCFSSSSSFLHPHSFLSQKWSEGQTVHLVGNSTLENAEPKHRHSSEWILFCLRENHVRVPRPGATSCSLRAFQVGAAQLEQGLQQDYQVGGGLGRRGLLPGVGRVDQCVCWRDFWFAAGRPCQSVHHTGLRPCDEIFFRCLHYIEKVRAFTLYAFTVSVAMEGSFTSVQLSQERQKEIFAGVILFPLSKYTKAKWVLWASAVKLCCGWDKRLAC